MRIAIFTEIRHLLEELITFLSIFWTSKIVQFDSWTEEKVSDQYQLKCDERGLECIHTLRVYYTHAAANLNSGYSKYAKVARVHYFCTLYSDHLGQY